MVDQDSHFLRRLEQKLSGIGHQSYLFDCYARAGQSVLQGNYNLLIVNIENTGDEGSRFVERFSKERSTPVIVTSTNGEVETKIHHLKIGAVDYVVKPVDFEEFMARVSVQLGKGVAHSVVTSKLVFDDLTIHLSSSSVERGGRLISLTKQEFSTLLYLARHQGEPVSREKLFENVWGNKNLRQANLINVAIGRLRKKIDDSFERKFLHTVHGIGYVAEYRD
ncbi:response regulator transcription factor [Pantoea sp. 18069]|uniref:response regulator transcription factor n=1 Tax=Pantoea sp. 18069 TaxID=2681415 RepID=UPI0013568B4A|nr:response regulator transcription factor [Pantoea sp. 18069]